jgi:hypothetical protein
MFTMMSKYQINCVEVFKIESNYALGIKRAFTKIFYLKSNICQRKDESRMDNPWTRARHWTQDTEQRQANQKIELKRHKDCGYEMPDHSRLSSHIT